MCQLGDSHDRYSCDLGFAERGHWANVESGGLGFVLLQEACSVLVCFQVHRCALRHGSRRFWSHSPINLTSSGLSGGGLLMMGFPWWTIARVLCLLVLLLLMSKLVNLRPLESRGVHSFFEDRLLAGLHSFIIVAHVVIDLSCIHLSVPSSNYKRRVA